MPFPLTDPAWIETRDFLKQHARELDAILAPNEFMEFFPGNYHYNITYLLPPSHFDYVVIHKGMVAEIEPPFALEVLRTFQPLFANAVFVVFAKQPPENAPKAAGVHLQPLLNQLAVVEAQQRGKVKPIRYGVTITTYNRPESLGRSLPQIRQLGAPVVIVDDASSPENAAANQRIADEHGVPLIRIPENRGLPNAMNVGIGYWLADPAIDWISYFQDDVDVHPDLFKILEKIQDPVERPILAGRDALEHPTFAKGSIAGYEVLFKRSMPGQHLHAHRDYWAGVMPIPTPYLGAPKPTGGKPGQGADEDWWITAWSPHAIPKRGKYLICVPGLVRSFQITEQGSTWGNISERQEDGQPIIDAALKELAVPAVAKADSVERVERDSRSDPCGNRPPDPPLAEPVLAGLKVLVDGYNLQLTTGTGIRTYAVNLIRALTVLGADVDVLLSRNSNKKDPILDEVLFFDEQDVGGRKLVENLMLVKDLLKSSVPSLYRAWRREAVGEVVLKQGKFTEDFIQLARSYNLPKCYSVANAAFNLFGRSTQVTIPEKIDLWHATFPLPVSIPGAKKVTTIHDLIPLRLPYTTLDNKKDFYNKVKRSLKDSTLTIAVSEHTKKDVLSYFDADPDKIVVTYQPVNIKPLDATPEEIGDFLKRYRLGYQNYLLFVGAIEPKKNVGRLLEAYAALETDLPLVIVGKKAWSFEDDLGRLDYLFDPGTKQDVRLLEYVPGDALRYLYQGAYCFVFPSLYEGFGLPPIEAMTMGCPVVTSSASCLPEVCGPAALYVNPYDVADIQAKLEQILGDRPLRDQLAETGKQVAQNFSLKNYLNRLSAAYLRAIG
ncbi:glycosyltransferase [Thermoleptolyngbya sichuanensis A183]|uniref:Glycosyltransferase n=1 Tax=Thermoleptolyngbya sichuanensis A183 TaxID=2737172 RepID=A0A6M8B729_9CYAN|nr:glycosyltransferase [Thermoleptolyngbya sichuanensis]QKD81952.1 glycosyltransferase [Thermoleptolyngbya sichuanensis A183]